MQPLYLTCGLKNPIRYRTKKALSQERRIATLSGDIPSSQHTMMLLAVLLLTLPSVAAQNNNVLTAVNDMKVALHSLSVSLHELPRISVVKLTQIT